MTAFKFYESIRSHGTVNKTPKDIPDPIFALPSTIHWMRALGLLIDHHKLDFENSYNWYKKKTSPRAISVKELNTICEQLLYSLNQVSTLRILAAASNKADVARMGIVTWYYGIYSGASAMIAASDGSFKETHAGTATQWDRQISKNGLALEPFSIRISSLLQKTVEQEIATLKIKGKHPLVDRPMNEVQAWGCITEYLSGTAKWEQWNIEERVKESREFKELGVSDFRTLKARNIRDNSFSNKSISFLHQASRYRGKANYRDAIFLAYGKGVPKLLEHFIDDLEKVLLGFVCMSAGYSAIRIGKTQWNDFIHDLKEKKSFSISVDELNFLIK